MSGDDVKGSAPIAYGNLNSQLLERLPQLRERYTAVQQLWHDEEPGPHVVYGDVLVPYLIETLTEAPEDPGLTTAFEFLEELLARGDNSTRDVVGGSVLEDLYDAPAARANAGRHMGPFTRGLAEQIGKAWH
jgi:hypothetical protein